MKNNTKGVSVIICCYNSADKIEKTLQYLSRQLWQPGLQYEIILVDNNCTDTTILKAVECWKTAGEPYPLHITEQSRAGLNYARQKGISFANYEYLVFCDDDNWLCNDYLKKMFTIFETKPDTVLAGGIGEAVFENYEKHPPAWFKAIKGFGYAVGDEGRQTGFTDNLYGAGMGIRKSLFEKLIGGKLDFILTDRKGTSLSSGGDTEICVIVWKAGYKIFFLMPPLSLNTLYQPTGLSGGTILNSEDHLAWLLPTCVRMITQAWKL